MKLDKFTVKAQEALQESQAIARKRDHQEILPEHLLAALLAQQDGLVPPLLQRIGADIGLVQQRLEDELRKTASVHGGEGGHLAQRTLKVLDAALATGPGFAITSYSFNGQVFGDTCPPPRIPATFRDGTSTTVLDAYIGPTLERYLTRLGDGLRGRGVTSRQVFIMQSNGGLMTIKVASSNPVQTLLSGPAAGVLFGAYLSRLTGLSNVVTFDVGPEQPDEVVDE